MEIEEQLTDAAEEHFEHDFEIIEMDKGETLCFDCSWFEGETEKRIRVKQEPEEELPKVFLCTDYVDERNSFGVLVLNQRIDADDTTEHLEIALERMFLKLDSL